MPILANTRHEKFVQHIATGMPVTQAYAAAGYSADPSNAAYLRAKPHIEARLMEIMGKAAKKTEITAERILNELSKIAFANPADFLTVADDGTVSVDLTGLNRDQAAAIVEVISERGADGKVRSRLKLSDKKAALETMGRSFGMWTDRVEQGRPGDFSAAKTADDVAEMLLKQAGVTTPSEQAIEQVKTAYAHLEERVNAVVSGELRGMGNG